MKVEFNEEKFLEDYKRWLKFINEPITEEVLERERKKRIRAIKEFNEGVNYYDIGKEKCVKELKDGCNNFVRYYFITRVCSNDCGEDYRGKTIHSLRKQLLFNTFDRVDNDFIEISSAEERDALIEVLQNMKF